MNRNIINTVVVINGIIAALLPSAGAQAQTGGDPAEARPGSSASASTPEASQQQTLYLHGFRSPSMGAEYRRGNIGLHSGLYLTILSKNETTRFQKTGVTLYFPSLDLSRNGKSEAYLSLAHVRGQNREYNNRNGVFLEPGVRWMLGNRLEARLGVGILALSGSSAKVNPTPGVSWTIPL